MGLLNWFESKIQKLNFWEFGLVKTVLILFGIIIGAYISLFVKDNLWYFVGALIIGYVIVLYRVLG